MPDRTVHSGVVFVDICGHLWTILFLNSTLTLIHTAKAQSVVLDQNWNDLQDFSPFMRNPSRRISPEESVILTPYL